MLHSKTSPKSLSDISAQARAKLLAEALKRAQARLRDEAHEQTRQYVPRGAAVEALTTEAAEFVLSGPAGTGKSRADLEKLHKCALTYPGMRGLIVRKTRVSLTESGLVTFERHVLGEDNPICANMQRENRHIYRYPNGSEIVVGGIDKPGRIMSTEFDLVVVLEATELSLTDWEALITRLRNGVMPYQQIIGDCNPDRPDHWLKKRADAGLLVMRDSHHEDNPVLWDMLGNTWTARGAAYIAKLDNLTGVRKLRLRYGRWAAAEGAVYEDWSESMHLIDRFEIPATWRRIRSIDFGYTNPFVCQWWAIDPDGRMYLYREIYHSQRLVEDHARQIVALSATEKIEATVADHDAEDRATLARHGVRTMAARKEIGVGVQAVQARLKPAGDGKPRLFVLRDSLVEADELLTESEKPVCLKDEIPGYVWAKSQDGKPIKEQPVDIDNHGLDALRYAVRYVDEPRLLTGRKDNPFFQ